MITRQARHCCLARCCHATSRQMPFASVVFSIATRQPLVLGCQDRFRLHPRPIRIRVRPSTWRRSRIPLSYHPVLHFSLTYMARNWGGRFRCWTLSGPSHVLWTTSFCTRPFRGFGVLKKKKKPVGEALWTQTAGRGSVSCRWNTRILPLDRQISWRTSRFHLAGSCTW